MIINGSYSHGNHGGDVNFNLENFMRSKYYLSILEEKHKKLDKEIQVAYNNRIDNLLLEQMKLKKLKIKQEIEKLKQALNESVNRPI